jgi:hypothetical protein
MKRILFFGISLFLLLAAADIHAKSRRPRIPSSMGSFGNVGGWLPRGPVFDFEHGAGIDIPGFDDPLDDEDDGGGGGGSVIGEMLHWGEGYEWDFGEDGDIDTTRGRGGCGIDDCYKATWIGPCEYKCQCLVTWDPVLGGGDQPNHTPGQVLQGKCYYGDWLNGTAPGDCSNEGQSCLTDDW